MVCNFALTSWAIILHSFFFDGPLRKLAVIDMERLDLGELWCYVSPHEII
ncbi:hypothetical protein PATSB16_04970 [Pandoraea thiooxydans]|nr:hypothetical protein PATSB16_04970 [Pandoraea thiooxydans]